MVRPVRCTYLKFVLLRAALVAFTVSTDAADDSEPHTFLTANYKPRSLLAVTTSAEGTLSKAGAKGICTYSGTFASCLGGAVFNSIERDLWINLTGTGCPSKQAAYRISEDGMLLACLQLFSLRCLYPPFAKYVSSSTVHREKSACCLICF